LTKKAGYLSEAPITTYQTLRCSEPQDRSTNPQRRKNIIKSHYPLTKLAIYLH